MIFPPRPGQVLLAAAAIAPPLAVIAPLGLTVLVALAALLAGGHAVSTRTWHWPPRLVLVLFAVFLVWAGASALWAERPGLVWRAWGPIALLGLCGLGLIGAALALDRRERERIGLTLAGGVVAGLVLLLIEWLSTALLGRSIAALFFVKQPYYAYVFNRGAATLALLVWPAAFALHRRFGVRAAMALIVAAPLILSGYESLAALLGLAGGIVVYLAALRWRQGVAQTMAVLLLVATLSAPLLPRLLAPALPVDSGEVTVSVTHRLTIWRFAAEAIAARPVLGWGLNSARELPGGERLSAPGLQVLPLHPHNAALQWWLELGAVGALIGATFLVAATLGAGALGNREAPAGAGPPAATGALALVAAAVLVAAVGYGIWQGWWMAALWLSAALMAAIGGPAGANPSRA